MKIAAPWELRFWNLVNKIEGEKSCWLWTASGSHNGYGQFEIIKDGKKKNARATHVAFFLQHKRWPSTPLLRHTCNTPACVRWDHLLEGNQKENIQDAVRQNRMALGERNGSAKLTTAQASEIKYLYSTGEWSQASLGAKFGCSQVMISLIVRGKKWERVSQGPTIEGRVTHRTHLRCQSCGSTDVEAIPLS